MNIKIEDIPESLHQMVEIVGIEKFVMICKMYGGATIYIPVYNKVVMGDRNRKIVRDYNGKKMVEIVGIEKFVMICKMYGGATIYIPVYNKVVMGDRNRKIVRDYNGKNLDKLRVRYNISKEQLKFILKKEGVIK